MAEPKPTMSGCHAGSEAPKEPLQQPKGALEMQSIHHTTPAHTAKNDDPPRTDKPTASTSTKGKEKELVAPSVPQEQTDYLSIGVVNAPADGPVCNITLLLPTGARHPYKIDDKYLTKRNVDVPELTESGKKDPFSISVYKLKELILREWREEWEGKPASPSSIRLIHFGKLLDDKDQLKKYTFNREMANVVHMSVKPAEALEEDEGGKGKSSGVASRNSENRSGCCVIL